MRKLKDCNTVLHHYPLLIRQHAEMLCTFSKMHPKAMKNFIKKAPAGFLKALSLIAYNLLNDTLQLQPHHMKRLTPYASNFRQFAQKTLSRDARRHILFKKAGFLPALAGVLASTILPNIVKSIFK